MGAMRKEEADPQNPPLEDLQGQVYQHELGDPYMENKIEEQLNHGEEAAETEGMPPHRVIGIEETEHRMEYQQQRAKSRLPAHITLPKRDVA